MSSDYTSRDLILPIRIAGGKGERNREGGEMAVHLFPSCKPKVQLVIAPEPAGGAKVPAS